MPAKGSRRVLIIDDEEDLTATLSLRLTAGWGFAVSVAHDGADGLLKASSFKPDVILLDLAMPKMDGWEMFRRLRADRATREIPVVVMTAWAADGFGERASELGAAKVLLKPFEETELLALLRGRKP